ncbi:MAG: sigma-54 dependent transcriptional regulator [Prevotellaceae bacterium]|jgi:DNA-binding NtrC family response regulator|nr:sigma-54 dependent transcriptional regulator [Prevotellaceae bacterium]
MLENFGHILIVDDNEDILFALRLLLKPYAESLTTSNNPANIPQLMADKQFSVILLDMNFTDDAFSGHEGFRWLDKILEIDPSVSVVFITAYGDTVKAVKAMKAGATDFVLKPWQNEKLLATVASAAKLYYSANELSRLQNQNVGLSTLNNLSHEIIGESAAMKRIFSFIEKLAQTEANVLILGENGTGKDLVAQALYRNSGRAANVFVSIDLGSISENLFESELFGYEKGAFTDARTSKPGRLELASGGTLFLDEIGNLSLPLQAKLLSAIEKKNITHLGATRPIDIDIRLICATNANLYKMTDDGLFRQDLLYRINTVEITLPPLRDRGNDILLLANYFLKRYTHKYKKNIASISRNAWQKLLDYPWYGNVRELQHVIERAVILTDASTLQALDFMLKETAVGNKNRQSGESNEVYDLDTVERQTIEKALRISKGNISKAAKHLGITRSALYRRMEKYGL